MTDPVAPAFFSVRHGVVREFDDKAGLGQILDGETATIFPFHCTAIADGSRTIPTETAVDFVLGFGRLGRVEARSVTALAAQGSKVPPSAGGTPAV